MESTIQTKELTLDDVKPEVGKAKASRSWILTLPAEHYSAEYVEKKLSKYTWAGQTERGKQGGDQGYIHHQIYVENPTPIQFETLRNKFPKGHFEPRRGSKRDAFNYVTKEDTRVASLPGRGEIILDDHQGQRTDLDELVFLMRDGGVSLSTIIKEYPQSHRFLRYLEKLESELLNDRYSSQMRDISVEYWWGRSGAGKTHSVYEQYGFHEVFRVTNYKNPFDFYKHQPVIVLDEFRSQLDFSFMLNLMDKYPLIMPARRYDVWAAHTKVLILSNIPLEEQYLEIQAGQPLSWEAFTRRIESVRDFL